MLHTGTVEAGTLDLLRGIQTISGMGDMRLVGGTALALQLGHRKSVDLDFFGRFDENFSFRRTLIAAMKMSAAANRGRNKDFIDIAFLLDVFSLSEMFKLYKVKFSVSDYSFALRGLTYFDDAEEDPMPEMLIPVTWGEVKKKIGACVRSFVDVQ